MSKRCFTQPAEQVTGYSGKWGGFRQLSYIWGHINGGHAVRVVIDLRLHPIVYTDRQGAAMCVRSPGCWGV